MPPRPPGRGRMTANPAASGELRWFAPAQGPQGWLVAGQTTRPWPATLPLAEARFEGAVLTGSLLRRYLETRTAMGCTLSWRCCMLPIRLAANCWNWWSQRIPG